MSADVIDLTQPPTPPPSDRNVDIRLLETVSAQLDSLTGLCWLLGHHGDDMEASAFFAIGNAIEHEKKSLDRAIAGKFDNPPDGAAE